jgi:hypothetical protein
MRFIKTFENYEQSDILIIIDVQKSFKKFFTEMYINQLIKYCNNFNEVYQIWDYLYEDEPEIPIHDDLYHFPNQKDIIEKRYNYDVDADFYKKILDKEVYDNISDMEESKSLKKGDIFPTKKGTVITYIGNKHVWFHCPKKLYELLNSLKGKNIKIVGGSDSECLDDVFTLAEKIGLNIKRDHRYIWSASHCAIK